MQCGKLPYQKSAIYMEMNGMLLGPQSLDYSAVWQVTLPEVSYLHGNEWYVVRTTKSGNDLHGNEWNVVRTMKSPIYMLLGPQSLDYSAVWQVTLPEVSYLHGNEWNVVRTTKSGLQCSVASYLTRSLLSTWK